eukprot:7948557-Pyramimonas_sp.AAC.1
MATCENGTLGSQLWASNAPSATESFYRRARYWIRPGRLPVAPTFDTCAYQPPTPVSEPSLDTTELFSLVPRGLLKSRAPAIPPA